MPTLKLKFKDTTIEGYSLDKGKSLTIGRLDDNNVTIENLAVSGHHAKIDSVGDGFLLTDLKSRNGSFVNGQAATSHWLQHGDFITIGKHTLEFGYEEGEKRPVEAPKGMDQTMIMDTDMYREMVAKAAPKSPPKAKKQEPVGILSFLSGGRGEAELTKKLTKIGKDASSDIVVSGLMVGKTAATISKRPNGYVLSYIGGISKPKIRGKAVKESLLLKEFDIIELGSAKIQFVYKG